MWKAWAKTDEGGPRLVLAVAIALGLVLALREQGLLMPIERALYDRWVQVRPNRPLDDRIVVVGRCARSDPSGQARRHRP
jgi:CHASE2 domain-containing sensor protein